MVSIKELFTYKKEVIIKNKKGKAATIYVRLIGDEDLEAAYKIARVASTIRRDKLKDAESIEYSDEIRPLSELTREELVGMVLGARRNKFMAEAFVKVNREELPKIEEVAIEPDAPSLEEQETLDKKFTEQDEDYQKRIDEYVEDRVRETEFTLESRTDEEVCKDAQDEMVGILPLQAFFRELNDQKGYRGSYEDKECKQRIFPTVDDFKAFDTDGRKQIIDAYTALEIGADEIKN